MKTERVGFAFCGSFCTHAQVLQAYDALTEEYETVIPIVSEISMTEDTRFGKAEDLIRHLEEKAKRPVIHTIQAAEPIGPSKLLDVLVIAPCTGNTLAKLAAGITDSTVTMAAKAHLRNARPVVLALASNDALSANARNIGELLSRRHYYFVPFGQDNPQKKPTSMIADFSLIGQTIEAALQGQQLQPILLK